MAAIEDVCTACGERNPAGSAFCLYCGVYLGWDEASTAERSSTAERPGARRSVPAGEAAVVSSEAPTRADQTRVQPTAQQWINDEHLDQRRPGESLCPQCGHPNASTLTFCSKCGHVLRRSQSTARIPANPTRQTWWQRFWDPADRRARRDYRRSLPPLYRWRRVIIAVLAIVVALVVLSVVGKNPVTWAKDRYYDVRGTLVVADQVTYAGDPPQSVAPGYDVAALGSAAVDDAWATAWSAAAVGPLSGCDGKPAAKGMVRLSFQEPVRVRRLDVLAGLPASNENRPLQFRPSVLLVMYEGRCTELQLKDGSDLQKLTFDTGVPVKDLIVAIGATYPARADAGQPFTALTSLAPLSRPH